MNDRFKFRVFLKYNQIMYDIDSYCFLQGLNKCVFHFTNGGQKTLKNDDFIIMQCTGLEDKNGKLIYEGDIVEDALMNRFTITFNEEYLSYLLTNIKTNEQMVFYPNIKLEVIGNIYENPELLEVE